MNALYSKYKKTKLSDKLLSINYNTHVVAIGGITAFIISILMASLPITYILLWYGRNYKKQSKLL